MAVPMWGKYFACTFTGSMFGCGLHAHVVWGYVISHTGLHDHLVELNPAVLAAAIGCDVEGIVKAIDFLCSPDPNSRSDREDGRRLIRRGQFTYYVVNHEEYSRLRNEVERRGQNRNAKRAQRARVSCDVVNDVSHGQPRSATVSGRGCPAMSLTMSAQREGEEEEAKDIPHSAKAEAGCVLEMAHITMGQATHDAFCAGQENEAARQENLEENPELVEVVEAITGKKRGRPKAPPDPRVGRLLSFYASEYERTQGMKSLIRFRVAGPALKRCLTVSSEEEIRAVITSFLGDPPRWLAERELLSPEIMASKFDLLRKRLRDE